MRESQEESPASNVGRSGYRTARNAGLLPAHLDVPTTKRSFLTEDLLEHRPCEGL